MMPYIVGGYEKTDGSPVLKEIDQPKHFNTTTMLQPTVVTNNLAWLIGLYTGDGSNHKAGIRIHGDARYSEPLKKAQSIIKDLFGLDGQIVPDYRKGGRLTLCVNSRNLLRYLKVMVLLKIGHLPL